MPANREGSRRPAHKQAPADRTERRPEPSAPSAQLAALQRAARGMRGMTPQDVMQLQRAVGNRAVRQMMADAARPLPTGPVIQRAGGDDDQREVFNLRGKKTSEQKYPATEFEDADGFSYDDVDNKFTSVTADKGLPTYYQVLSTVYGEDNLNKTFFTETKAVDDKGGADRAREVTAELVKPRSTIDRIGNSMVTAIGNLGNQEVLIRGGDDPVEELEPPASPAYNGWGEEEEETPPTTSTTVEDKQEAVDDQEPEERPLATSYQGGHLVGWKVFGPGSDQMWNVAPMDAKNNEQAYKNTIENMLLKADAGTQYTYTVKVQYETDNFRVDQNQLKKHKVLNKLVKGKPWAVTLPSRIPRHWEAKAVKSSGKFGAPTNEESSNKQKEIASTYEQYSQGMDESKLRRGISSHTARYNLTFNEDRKISVRDVRKKPSLVKTAHYRMHQVLPDDRDMGIYSDDYAPEESFGSVKVNEITLQDVEKLKREIESLLAEVTSIPDPEPVDVDIKTWLTGELFNMVFTAPTTPVMSTEPSSSKSTKNKRSRKKQPKQIQPSVSRLATFATKINMNETRQLFSDLNDSIAQSRVFDATMEEEEIALDFVQTSMQAPVFADLSMVTEQSQLQGLHRDLRSHRDQLHNLRSVKTRRKETAAHTKRKRDTAFQSVSQSVQEVQTSTQPSSFTQQEMSELFSLRTAELTEVEPDHLVLSIIDRVNVDSYKSPEQKKKKTSHASSSNEGTKMEDEEEHKE